MACLAALLLLSLAAAARADERPNLVLLLTDDQTTYSLGCYGNPDVRTPHIDRLAREGMLLDNHYDTTAICMGSRANIFTGRYEFRHGCNFSHGPLLRQHWRKSYPLLLRAAGYRTAMAGKIGIEVAGQPGGKGSLPAEDFDRWGAGPGQTHYATARNPSIAEYAEQYPHSTRAYGAFGRDFIRDAAGEDKPFCLSISFKAPHRPATPDPAFDSVYAGRTFAKPENYGREHGLHFAEQSRRGRQYARFTEWNYDSRYDEVMRIYHQQVYGIDVAVGMIRDALREHGVDRNTVIVFTSDNGFLCGSHGYGSKVLPYEESSRVPCILYDPRVPRDRMPARAAALTANVDVPATLLDLAGVDLPEGMDGRSLMALVDDPDDGGRPPIPLINVWGPAAVHSLGVVSSRWKYVYWPYAGGGLEPAEELYDLQQDPLELTNLAAAGPRGTTPSGAVDELQRMRRHYDELVERWRREAVPYHGYQQFAVIFDRHADWSRKAPLVRSFGR